MSEDEEPRVTIRIDLGAMVRETLENLPVDKEGRARFFAERRAAREARRKERLRDSIKERRDEYKNR